MLYRIKQFLWAIKSTWINIDYKYVKNFLNDEEFYLFNQLKKCDQYHCIRVCKDSIIITKKQEFKIDEKIIGKLALLHDIGKINKHINILVKSILVIMHKVSKGKLRENCNIGVVDSYYNHGEKGAFILTNNESLKGIYSEQFLEALKNHHSKECLNNILLNILKEADNKN